MGCCESREHQKDSYDSGNIISNLQILKSSNLDQPSIDKTDNFLNEVSNHSSTLHKLIGLDHFSETHTDPDLIPDYKGLEYLSSLEDTQESILLEKLRQADALLQASHEFLTDFKNDGVTIKFQEYSQGKDIFYAGLTEIEFSSKVPTHKLVHFLNHKSKRIQWDYDVKAIEIYGDFINDYIQFTRIENPKIFRKFYVERRLTKKYRNQVLILSFSISFDPDSVPKHINRMATLGSNLLTAFYIKQYEGKTILSIVNLYEHTEVGNVEEKIKVREGQNWVSVFKKLLESENDIYEPRPTV